MLRLALYLSRKFVLIWLGTTFGFLLLIGLLDSLANGGDIIGENGFADTFRYMFLRAPVIFERIFVFTFVVASLLVFVSLIRNHELVALLCFGISVPRQILALAPAVLVCAVGSVAVLDAAMPPAVRSLQAWGVAEYQQRNITPDNPLWLEDDRRIVRAAGRDGFERLSNIEFYSRTDSGQVKTALWAAMAEYRGDGSWELSDVRTLEVAGADGETREAVAQVGPSFWQTSQTPDSIARLAAEPRDTSLADLRRFSMEGNGGTRPSFAYRFWWLHRLTRPVAILLLLALSVALMQRVGRQDTGDRALVVGIAAGFLFLILDGAMATFATSGSISPPLAVGLPLVATALLAGYLVSRTEAL